MAWTTFREIPWNFGSVLALTKMLRIRYSDNGNRFTVVVRYISSYGVLENFESPFNGMSDFDYSKYRYRISLKNLSSFGSHTFAAKPSDMEVVLTDTNESANNHTGVTILIERDEKNTAPTTPGPFVQPTGILEIGDSKTISWGASTDAESNFASYVLEVSINNGAWTQIGIPTVNNFTYTIPNIPTATKIQFRVKARDATGLESAFRESSIFTVQPPQYYWSKYKVTNTYVPNGPGEWQYNYVRAPIGTETYNGYVSMTKYPTYMYSGAPKYEYHVTGIPHTGASDGYSQIGSTEGILNIRFTLSEVVVSRLEVSYEIIPSRGALVQSDIKAAENAYVNNTKNNDGFWYVRGSRVSESITPPQGITSPAPDTVFRPGNIVNIAFTASAAANISAYEVDYRYNNDAWTPLAANATLTRSLTATTDSTKTTIEFRVRAKNTSNVYSDYIYSPLYTIQHNVAPVVTLDTENNKILFENDSFNILGAVQDTDKDNTVTVRYQISGGAERAIKAYLSNGSQELYSKTLTFKGGKLYDGETLIAGDLVDGTLYTLRVWATDDKGGTSAIAERAFYVVPNRAPSLTVNSPIIQGTIENDKFTVDGEFADPDNNTAIVTYRINGGNSVQVAEGTSGTFDFEVSFGQLKIGENVIAVEAVDSYGAKVTKSIKLNKSVVETALLKSTARYKIDPPKGSAKAVLLWIQRAEALAIDVSISMQMKGEAESYEVLTPNNTAPITSASQVVEDEFYYEAASAKDSIILQIDMTRESVEVNDAILLISGVLE